jgi:hypothetical protein
MKRKNAIAWLRVDEKKAPLKRTRNHPWLTNSVNKAVVFLIGISNWQED